VHGLFEGLLIAGVTLGAMALAGALWVRHRLRRQLRIAPKVRSAAPTRFVVLPTPPARLHGRLRRTATAARLAATIDPGLAPLADDLVAEALALEPRVIALHRTGRAGSLVRRDLSARIAELEAVSRRLTQLSTAPSPSAPGALRDRMDALEAAREELAEIDLRAGLATPI
jgi:hypothetical protein